MASRLSAINKLRPKIQSQGVADLEELADRMARQSTTFDGDEIYGIFRKMMREIIFALQNGETVKLDDVMNISPIMKVGGEVNLSIRGDRSAIAGLNDPKLWTADKVKNHENLSKTSDELVALWNANNPSDPVV